MKTHLLEAASSFPREAPDCNRRTFLSLVALFPVGSGLITTDAWSAGQNNAGVAGKTALEGPDGVTELELANALRRLQQAVAANDAIAVAALVSFPLQVNLGSRGSRWMRARFLSSYVRLFDHHLRGIVAAQTPQTLSRSSRGAMVGDGEIWLAGVCLDNPCRERAIQVVAMNIN